MKRLPTYLLMVAVAVSLAWIAGCRSPEGPEPGVENLLSRTETTNFNDPYGGFNMGDESPGFGDQVILNDFAADAEVIDPMNDAPDVDSDHPDRAFLLVTWGNLHRDETISEPTDWTGALSVDKGAIILKRIVRFEQNDHIVERTQRDLLEWVSHTLPAWDGVLVKIVPPSSNTDTASGTDVNASDGINVRFRTAPLSVEFALSDLQEGRRVINLDDGNAVAFTLIKVSPDACPSGFLHGAWRNHPERRGGKFFGRWVTENGHHMGFLRGIYGVNDHGEKVFFGKMIDREGRFQGIMAGEWGNNDGETGGWFAGRWVDRSLRVKGRLKGEWRRSDHCDGGFFRGVWATNCN